MSKARKESDLFVMGSNLGIGMGLAFRDGV
jgi:hypothetical protein